MAAPTAQPAKITITSGVKGQPITIFNRTTGEMMHTKLGDTAKAVVDLQNFESGVSDGDVIDFMVTGEVIGQNTTTVSGDLPATLTISTSAVTSGMARGM